MKIFLYPPNTYYRYKHRLELSSEGLSFVKARTFSLTFSLKDLSFCEPDQFKVTSSWRQHKKWGQILHGQGSFSHLHLHSFSSRGEHYSPVCRNGPRNHSEYYHNGLCHTQRLSKCGEENMMSANKHHRQPQPQPQWSLSHPGTLTVWKRKYDVG